MGTIADKISGKANELAGKARQGVGAATDDREMEAKGVAQEAKGDAQQTKGQAKDAVKRSSTRHNAFVQTDWFVKSATPADQSAYERNHRTIKWVFHAWSNRAELRRGRT